MRLLRPGANAFALAATQMEGSNSPDEKLCRPLPPSSVLAKIELDLKDPTIDVCTEASTIERSEGFLSNHTLHCEVHDE